MRSLRCRLTNGGNTIDQVMNTRLTLGLLVISVLSLKGQGTLVVANKNENTVSIISLKTGTEIKRIDVGQGPHEVAISPSGNKVVVANYGNKQVVSNSLTVIDLNKLQKVTEISLGEYTRPHGIEFSNEDEVLVTCEVKQLLLKVNITTASITVVAKTDQVASHMVAYAKTDHLAYVANIVSGTVSMIDVGTNALLRQLEFKRGIEGVTVSPDGMEVWVANRDDSTVIAMNTKTLGKSKPMAAHQVAYRIKFLPNGNHVVVSNGISGNLSVYDANAKKHIMDINLVDPLRPTSSDVPNMPIPVGLAVSHDSQYVFVSLAGYGQVALIRVKDWVVEKRISTGSGPDGIYYSQINK